MTSVAWISAVFKVTVPREFEIPGHNWNSGLHRDWFIKFLLIAKSVRQDFMNQIAVQVQSFRPCPHVSGYFRIRNKYFFFPDTATVHTYPANSTANPKKNKSAIQSGKNISATNPITCGRVNPDIFESDDVKSVSSLSPNNTPIWRLTWKHVSSERSKFPATISLYGACSEDILGQRSLGY